MTDSPCQPVPSVRALTSHTERSLALSFSQTYSLFLLPIDPLLLPYATIRVSLVAQMVKNLPAMQKPWVGSPLGQEDTLEKEMATHSSILAWRIPWTEDLAGYSSWSRKELDMTEGRSACIHTHTFKLLYSCHYSNCWSLYKHVIVNCI